MEKVIDRILYRSGQQDNINTRQHSYKIRKDARQASYPNPNPNHNPKDTEQGKAKRASHKKRSDKAQEKQDNDKTGQRQRLYHHLRHPFSK